MNAPGPRAAARASLARRGYRRGLALLPPAGQVEVKRALLAVRQRLRALATRRRRLLAARRPRRFDTDGVPHRPRRPLVTPPGDPRAGVALVTALGHGRDGLARACEHAADLCAQGTPVVVCSDDDGVDLARAHGLVLELVPPRDEWRAAMGASDDDYDRFVAARLAGVADAWGASEVHHLGLAPGEPPE